MSDRFRALLQTIGSGSQTGGDLSRSDAATAMRLMLQQAATPAQIGAFFIAHRIKRPTPEELAGMLDAYDELGPKLAPPSSAAPAPIVLGIPHDGRARTVPVTPITALLLAAAGVPAITHGGDVTPTKYGVPLSELWQALGLAIAGLSLARSQQIWARTGLGFVYLPAHFPAAHALIPYRDQIGKRPPVATAELIWLPYSGSARAVAGFVHPPTEPLLRQALALRGVMDLATVKGLEGSCDLARNRTAIIGLPCPGTEQGWERLHLRPQDYSLGGTDLALQSKAQLFGELRAVLHGRSSDLMPAAIWNGGFYLWYCGACADLASGLTRAEQLLARGEVAAQAREVARAARDRSLVPQNG
ncbi:MAG: hypothetical protein BRC58_11465 [Cyanobacteria bacterium QS_8_64_29]|nr:MAG: hypothetical protein BRC58_11465 [Cyanobacteria bacterium QS_8_64_29]